MFYVFNIIKYIFKSILIINKVIIKQILRKSNTITVLYLFNDETCIFFLNNNINNKNAMKIEKFFN